ncbi:unnamed protein product [Effrenium voratum]|uniref:Uncharacterized protein n=1 Tax=Effrenium voratum TaxID=2562239 RepID=A0AA36IAH2_9DINO|nr:unnamed protein product [Effrenium voratum]
MRRALDILAIALEESEDEDRSSEDEDPNLQVFPRDVASELGCLTDRPWDGRTPAGCHRDLMAAASHML